MALFIHDFVDDLTDAQQDNIMELYRQSKDHAKTMWRTKFLESLVEIENLTIDIQVHKEESEDLERMNKLMMKYIKGMTAYYKRTSGETPSGCAVCLEKFNTDKPTFFTECGHRFHFKCFQCLRCPLCQQGLYAFEDVKVLRENLNG